MACSKLFSGDLPEISSHIIRNLRNNHNTLYSLALVNRFWCCLAIPLLWEDPFSIKYRENFPFHFLDTYFLFLNDNDKSKLKEIEFCEFDSKLYKPLFNYPSLIKTLNFFTIRLHVTNWINPISIYYTRSVRSLEQYLSKKTLTYLQSDPADKLIHNDKDRNKIKVICIVLFNLFIESNASLNSLHMKSNNLTNQLFNDICKYCNTNDSKFISEIEIFSFDYRYSSMPLGSIFLNEKLNQTFLSSLPSLLTTSIKHIDFYISHYRLEPLFKDSFVNLLQSQSQLSSVKIGIPTKYFEVSTLNSLKNSSNTLTSINFYGCNFSNTMRLDILSYLTQLESLQFINCNGLNLNVVQPLLNITTLKIKTFVLIDAFSHKKHSNEMATSIQLLIQKIGSYIENLVLIIYEDELRRKLFDIVIDFCERVKFLHLSNIGLMNISKLSEIISKFNNYLKYLILKVKFDDNNDKISSKILIELSKFLPSSLHYLDLNLLINPDDLQIVFENCKQVELKKLLIKNRNFNSIDTTLKVIKDFVKEKNLEFLAYCVGTNETIDERVVNLKSLEKLVEETQSFIKMVKYDDLAIRVSKNDGNLIIN